MPKLASRGVFFATLAVPIAMVAAPLTASADGPGSVENIHIEGGGINGVHIGDHIDSHSPVTVSDNSDDHSFNADDVLNQMASGENIAQWANAWQGGGNSREDIPQESIAVEAPAPATEEGLTAAPAVEEGAPAPEPEPIEAPEAEAPAPPEAETAPAEMVPAEEAPAIDLVSTFATYHDEFAAADALGSAAGTTDSGGVVVDGAVATWYATQISQSDGSGTFTGTSVNGSGSIPGFGTGSYSHEDGAGSSTSGGAYAYSVTATSGTSA
jgi:hypothetical protein